MISGADLIEEVAAGGKGKSFFFLGGWGERAKKTALNFSKKYPGLRVGYSPGEPTVSNEEVIKKINKFRPDFLWVAYGMRRQEEWIYKNKEKLRFGTVTGVGRSFDYYSGELKRAPQAWRRVGLEWLYSLLKEPKRLKRQMELPKFIWWVMNCP